MNWEADDFAPNWKEKTRGAAGGRNGRVETILETRFHCEGARTTATWRQDSDSQRQLYKVTKSLE